MTITPEVTPTELAAMATGLQLELKTGLVPDPPLIFVNLETEHAGGLARVACDALGVVLIGVCDGGPTHEADMMAQQLDCALCRESPPSPAWVQVANLPRRRATLATAVERSPRAALTLAALLRCQQRLPVIPGLVAESLAYSALLAGSEYIAWRRERTSRAAAAHDEPAVIVERDAQVLRVMLNRPARHNAFNRGVRDGLIEAFDLAALDETIARVELGGVGPSFCSGGDLDEFGLGQDPVASHLIRLDRSVGRRIERARDRTYVSLHGACIGAGIELPAFAGHVMIAPDTEIALPELGMGLIPGAGGTVSITRRIGRWRTAYLALTGEQLDAATAMDWGIADEWLDG